METQWQVDVPVPSQQLPIRPKAYASPADWESQRRFIKNLYLEQNKALKEVEQIMSEKHGFYATTGMYKRRIKQWGFDKKLKKHEVIEMLHQKSERDSAGKSTKFFIRGRNVDVQKIKRYVEGKPDILSQLGSVYENQPSGAVICRTPSPVVPVALPSPPDTRKLEEIITVLRNYVDACASGPESRWILTPEGFSTRSPTLVDLHASRASMLGAWDELSSLHLSMEHTTSPAEMFQVLDTSLNKLKDSMRDELPEFVIMMLYLLRFTWPGHPLLLRMFRKHVGDLSAVLLGVKHPLTLIWRDAVNLGENFDEVVEEVLRVLFTELVVYLGPDSDVVELARRGWRYAPNSLQGMAEVMRQYQTWLAAHPNWPSSMLRSFLVQIRLMIANIDETTPMSQLLEAHGTIQTILDAQGTKGQFPINTEEAWSLANLDGGISWRLGNVPDAEWSLLMAVGIAKHNKLPSRNEMISLRNLEILYKANGKRAKLASITKDIKDLESRTMREADQ